MNWLKQRRRELHLSQEELSIQLQLAGFDVSRATVSHWETGRNTIPLDNPNFVEALANSLNMGIMELLASAGYIKYSKFGEDATKAAALVDSMPASRRKMAVGILEQLLREG
jgi:transcriptional regulator with XRE-family HTH domain